MNQNATPIICLRKWKLQFGPSLHPNLPAHQARQQQVAGSFEFVVLEFEVHNLRENWLNVIVEQIQKPFAGD
jgi:hypothetical protein